VFALNDGYFHAWQTEIAARRGQQDLLRISAEEALRLLPAQEVLLRARVSAYLAQALWRNNQHTEALQHFVWALRQDPGLFRRLDISIPVTLAGTSTGHITASEIQPYLRRSPRFEIHNQGLALELMQEEIPTLCLRAADGDALSCIQLAPVAVSDSTPVTAVHSDAQRLVQQFHEGTFSLAYDISRTQRLALLGNSVIFSNQNNNAAQDSSTLLQR
jgi:hypothetical protein